MSAAARIVATIALGAAIASALSGPGQVAAAGPAWHGRKVWAALSRLNDFAYSSSVLEGYEFQAVVYDQSARYARGSYRIDLVGKAAQFAIAGATSLVRAGGRYYIRVTSRAQGSALAPGWYRLGREVPKDYLDIVGQFGGLRAVWQARLAGSRGTYDGTCVEAGRHGLAFRVLYPDPDPTLGKWIAGTACLDKSSGAPLRLSFSLRSNDRSGSPVDIVDRFRVTSVGKVPSIHAPASRPAPSLGSSQ